MTSRSGSRNNAGGAAGRLEGDEGTECQQGGEAGHDGIGKGFGEVGEATFDLKGTNLLPSEAL